MALAARDVLQRCVDILQDDTSVRWPIDELIRYLNDGQREIVLYRPDSTNTSTILSLVEGSKQRLPADGSKLIEVVRNSTSSSSRSVRLVNREILDAQTPQWHDLTPSDEVLHYMYDPRDPTVFYVYPPSTSNARLEISYSKYPATIPAVGAGREVGSIPVTASYLLSVPDIYGNAIQDYVLFRAYSKDSEYAGNAQRAQAHYAAFANALGLEIQATVQVAPNPAYNPNAA
jgi:hypothetical protein